MHIALVTAFPNLPSTAEIEFTLRFKRSAEKLGHHAYEVVTSDDIHDCRPDFVIATHEFTPKLTPFFTLVALWSPPNFYSDDEYRIRSILSHDGYLVGSAEVGRFLDDLEFSTGIAKPRSGFRFLPTAPSTDFVPRPAETPYELVYVGVHWDGNRHGGLLDLISREGDVAFYGPAGAWRDFAHAYKGEVPFDGSSMRQTLARHGLALCLHKKDHRKADTPSMRLFEAAAAGCLIITDEIPFARDVLGDSVFRLEIDKDSPEKTARRVGEILRWANANREAADAMARRSHDILKQDYSLERTIEQTCDFVVSARDRQLKAYRAAATFAEAKAGAGDEPLVDVVIRTGGRSVDFVRRAIRSIADQTVGTYRVILADYKGRADIEAMARREATRRMRIDYLPCTDSGYRSSTLWQGLQAVRAPFFAVLDDDDAVMPDHFGHLLATARAFPDHPLYYSGVVRVEEEPVEFMSPPNFGGPMEMSIPERRELKFMDQFDLFRLMNLDNFIQSNAWIARSDALDERLLVDPKLVVCEDMYLYYMLARHGAAKLSPYPTAYWNWRSASADNSMTDVDPQIWVGEMRRIALRLGQEVMAEGVRFGPTRNLVGLLQKPGVMTPLLRKRLKWGETYVLHDVIRNHGSAGLNAIEEAGVWTATSESVLRMRANQELADFELTLPVTLAGNKRRPQRLTVSVNGQEIFDGPARIWRPFEVQGIVRLHRPTADIVLRVSCAYTISPRDEGHSQDPRQLGVFLTWVRIDDAKEMAEPDVQPPIGLEDAFRK